MTPTLSNKGDALPIVEDLRRKARFRLQNPDLAIEWKAADTIIALESALAGVKGRFDYAVGMYHDATRWSAEDDPDGGGSLLDYVFADVRAALSLVRGEVLG